MRKIILEMEYIYKIYQMFKFFKRIALFYPEMILRPFNSGAPRVGQSPIPMEYGQPLFVWLSRD